MATWRWALAMGFVITAACNASTGDGSDGAVSDADLTSPTDNGAGAADARFDINPCENPAAFASANKLNLIMAKQGQHEIDGTDGNDLIVGTGGDDTINGGKGDDVICAGGGVDTVHGNEGNDYIDGGSDNDKLFGDDGNDIIHGRGGGDEIHGGEGDDQVFGDILDDKLWGDGGNDLIVGGHGTDQMHGGDGNDYMRGDTGNDTFDGGAGQDVASFITAMPPGQPDKVFDGMRVDFTNPCLGSPDGKPHDGCANGDGGNEPLDSIEIVIGSPYKDQFTSSKTLKTKFVGGYGDDECDGAKCGTPLPAEANGKVFVSLDTGSARDTGLVVIGTTGDDDLEIIAQGDAFKVSGNKAIFAGPGCVADNSGVSCTPKHVLRWIAAYADDGNDHVRLAAAAERNSKRFPADMTAHVSGGEGNDTLEGGVEEDVLFSGVTGEDHLFGNEGDDALLSESRKWPARDCSGMKPEAAKADPTCTEDKPKGAEYTDGADELSGGPGDDQLVADYPCGGHLYSGGGGKDVAGFARSGRFDIHAQLTGVAKIHTKFYGRAFNPQLCDMSMGTKFMADDMEILEAADGNDELWGNDAPNTIWGREGNDIIHGLGGDDLLMGLVDHDTIYGGAGNDTVPSNDDDTVYPDAD